MTVQFGRIAYLDVVPPIVARPFRISGLRLTFRVTKSVKEGNEAEVIVYNLSDATRARLQEHDQELHLFAGYEEAGGPKLLFLGDIVAVDHSFPYPETVTRIKAVDGYKAGRDGVVSLSYSPGVSAMQVVRDLAKSLGAPEKFMAKLTDQKFAGGFSFTGRAKDGLQQILKFLGAEYTIQNGGLKVLEQGKGDDGVRSAPLLTADSGLIGSPERVREVTDETKPEAEKKKPGWKVRCLLRPEVEPRGWLAIQSRALPRPTAFPVERVEHTGDTHPQGDEAWESVVEVLDPGVPV